MHKTIIQTEFKHGHNELEVMCLQLGKVVYRFYIIISISYQNYQKTKKKEEYKWYNILETNNYELCYARIIFTDKTNEKYNDDDGDDDDDNVEGHHAKGQ